MLIYIIMLSDHSVITLAQICHDETLFQIKIIIALIINITCIVERNYLMHVYLFFVLKTNGEELNNV